jgi:hypothetical protein
VNTQPSEISGFEEVKPEQQTQDDAHAGDSNQADQPCVDAYYDSARKEYLVRNQGERWLSHATTAFKMLVREKGFSTKIPEGSRISPAEKIMIDIMDTRDVRYAAPLAGRKAGFYDESGVRFLVTDSPRIIAPVEGDWDTIRGLLHGLVGQEPEYGKRQYETLMGWIKIGYEALASGKRQSGQALAMAGVVNCGKSLLQLLITEILGGRSAKPYRYMAGGTDFNSDLFAAEHLMLEDEETSTDIRSRLKLKARIKEITVNQTQSCHAKGREAVTLSPFWRLTISLNDEDENLMVLPPMSDDLADKITLLRCSVPQAPFPTGTLELKEAYWARLTSELPAFIHYLTTWTVPPELSNQRYGIRHFHHPDLLSALAALAPETKLLELIDREIWKDDEVHPWQGNAGELESMLRRPTSDVRQEADRLLAWGNACGSYLGRLAKKHPDRVKSHRSATSRRWTITPPPDDAE